MNEFKDCIRNPVSGDEFCYFHSCGPYDDEQCGKEECPHCQTKTIKTEKLQLTNSYLKAKDNGEIA